MEKSKQGMGVAAAFVAAAILFVFVGFTIVYLRLSADKGGYLAGQGLVYGVLAWVVLGLVLRSAKAANAWPLASCLAAFLFMFGLFIFSGVSTQVHDQQKAFQAALTSMITQMSSETKMPPAVYPESTYGKYASLLVSMDRDLHVIQQQRLDMEAKEQATGKLDFDTMDTFAIETNRTAEFHKVEILREVNTEAQQVGQRVMDVVDADVQNSQMDSQEKQDFIQSFNKSAKPRQEEVQAVAKLALQLDDVYDDMLNIAAQDHPRVVNSRLLFNSHDALLRFQADATKIKPLGAQLRQERAQFIQDKASDLKTLTATNQ
jgi:hypothetical protein